VNKLIIANWKMQLSHDEAVAWYKNYYPMLKEALESSHNFLALCVPFTDLDALGKLVHHPFLLAAQNCSSHEKGAYTGEVSARSLAELSCSYALVGHSERRLEHGETNETIALKAIQLLDNNIEPIICVGETEQERDEGKTGTVIEQQLSLLMPLYKQSNATRIIIAYEPVWSIGTQQIPRASDISSIFKSIRMFLKKNDLHQHCCLLYGGNVNEYTIKDFIHSSADGFLLGRASLDAQTLKKIIISC